MLSLFLAPLVAVLFSLLLEASLGKPRLLLKRLSGCLALHAGAILILYAAGALVFARIWFACAHALAWWLFILVVNQVKFSALREPFTFQDFEYFTDLFRHPRLYLPFFGYFNAFLGIAGTVLLFSLGLWLEPNAWQQFSPLELSIFYCSVCLLSLGLLGFGYSRARTLQPSFDAYGDAVHFGLIAGFFLYARAERSQPALPDSFARLQIPHDATGQLPHLVAVQSESFFDARRLWPHIAEDVYGWLDEARRESEAFGLAKVPAWGANTVRSEFAFLSGLPEKAFGVHRFNPYRCLRNVSTLATALRAQGYHTVCVHPYAAEFYRRNKVYPGFGFDEFIDIRAFQGNQEHGPYIGDEQVASHVADLLGNIHSPLFVFVITMENHGPLHLEKIEALESESMFSRQPDFSAHDLAVYLRHVRNAGVMWSTLKRALRGSSRGGKLCWYGDHVPILPEAYRMRDFEDSRTDWFVWSSQHAGTKPAHEENIALHDLARYWLDGGQKA